ncbi:MAG: hypothetical protein PUE51_12635 [Veillonellaceae bacterium]|nr:hypothetical protein [Veillonellaceae bacterium]
MVSGECRTRKATKEELEAAKRDASFDLWRTYGRRLGEKGEKPKSWLFLRRFREQWTNPHRVVGRDGKYKGMTAKKPVLEA